MESNPFMKGTEFHPDAVLPVKHRQRRRSVGRMLQLSSRVSAPNNGAGADPPPCTNATGGGRSDA